MADAYSVMATAKTQGAKLSARKKFDEYMEKVRDEQRRAEKAGWLGGLGGTIFGSISSFLAPALTAAMGLGTGGLGSMLLAGLAGTGISRGGTEVGDVLARKLGKAGKKTMGDVGKYEGISGPYGRGYESELKRSGKAEYKQAASNIEDLIDAENISRWISASLSGIGTAGKVRSAADLENATIGEKMRAALEGDIGSGYRKGAQETVDWWKYGGRGMKPLELSETSKLWSENPYDLLSELSNLDKWTGYQDYDKWYGQEPSLLDKILESYTNPRERTQ